MSGNIQVLDSSPVNENSFDDMFSDLPELDPFEYKKARFAAQMAALAAESGKSRTEIAELLDMKKSSLTRLLSGSSNPTLKTVWSFAYHLGFDVDLAFRNDVTPAPKQPWEHNKDLLDDLSAIRSFPAIRVAIQSAGEVLIDMITGDHSPYYLCVESLPKTSFSTFSPIPIESNETKPLTIENFSSNLDLSWTPQRTKTNIPQ